MKLLEETKKMQQLRGNDQVTNALKDQEMMFMKIINACLKVKNETDNFIKKTAVIQKDINSNLTDCQKSFKETIIEFHRKVRALLMSFYYMYIHVLCTV